MQQTEGNLDEFLKVESNLDIGKDIVHP